MTEAPTAEIEVPFNPEGVGEPSGLPCLVLVGRYHRLVLSVQQLLHENLLPNQEVTTAQLLNCARRAGMRAEKVVLGWDDLTSLGNAFPAVTRLKAGNYVVLLRLTADEGEARVIVKDPTSRDDELLAYNRQQLERIWTGEVVLIRKNLEIREEAHPFNVAFVKELIFRERRVVRDIGICALVLGFTALLPMLFWIVLIPNHV